MPSKPDIGVFPTSTPTRQVSGITGVPGLLLVPLLPFNLNPPFNHHQPRDIEDELGDESKAVPQTTEKLT
jgi:hypothetical protein